MRRLIRQGLILSVGQIENPSKPEISTGHQQPRLKGRPEGDSGTSHTASRECNLPFRVGKADTVGWLKNLWLKLPLVKRLEDVLVAGAAITNLINYL